MASLLTTRIIFVLHVLILPFWCLGYLLMLLLTSIITLLGAVFDRAAGLIEVLGTITETLLLPLYIIAAPLVLVIGCLIVFPICAGIALICKGILSVLTTNGSSESLEEDSWSFHFPTVEWTPRWPKWNPEPTVAPAESTVAPAEPTVAPAEPITTATEQPIDLEQGRS